MKYQIVKNPGILTDLKKPVQMEILGLKMRASQGKRCMIVLIQWFQKCTLQIPRDLLIHFCNGYFKVYLFFF